MKLQNGTVLKSLVDHIKGGQASTNDIVKPEDDFCSVCAHSGGTSVPVNEPYIVEPCQSNRQRCPLNVIVMKTQLKVGEDVVTLTEHSLEFLAVRMHVILYDTFL